MPKVLVLFAHPRLEKSRSNKALLRRLPKHSDITFRDLYEIHPDFNIDIGREQALLEAHDIIVWHHPLYWYSAPPLLKQWIDMVLAFGWAYGPGGTALRGKSVFQVLTTGGTTQAYSKEGFHGWTIHEFLRPFERTVTLCGMHWLPPFIVHGTNLLGDTDLELIGEQYARLLIRAADGHLAPHAVSDFALLNEAVPISSIR